MLAGWIGRLGFTAVDNRICVALSRARLGFYCACNLEMLTAGSASLSRAVAPSPAGSERFALSRRLGAVAAGRAARGRRRRLRCPPSRSLPALRTGAVHRSLPRTGAGLPLALGDVSAMPPPSRLGSVESSAADVAPERLASGSERMLAAPTLGRGGTGGAGEWRGAWRQTLQQLASLASRSSRAGAAAAERERWQPLRDAIEAARGLESVLEEAA